MTTPTPPPANDINPMGCLAVVGMCVGLFIMLSPNRERKAVVDSAPTMRTETPQQRRPDPKPEPKRELTEAEQISQLKSELRAAYNPKPAATLDKLAKTSIPQTEIIDLIIERMLLVDYDNDGLATYLAAHYGKAGVAAYLKAHPKGVVWPPAQNVQPSDRAFRTQVEALLTVSREDLLDVLLEHPDRLALFNLYTSRAWGVTNETVRAAAFEQATRHPDFAIRRRAMLCIFSSSESAASVAIERIRTDTDTEIRWRAVYLLAGTTDKAEEAVDTLRPLLADPDPQVRFAACATLIIKFKTHQAEAVPVLLELAAFLRVPSDDFKYGKLAPFGRWAFAIEREFGRQREVARDAVSLLLTLEPEQRAKVLPLILELATKPPSESDYPGTFWYVNGPHPGLLAVQASAYVKGPTGHLVRPPSLPSSMDWLATEHPDEAAEVGAKLLDHKQPRVRWLGLNLLARGDPAKAKELAPIFAPIVIDKPEKYKRGIPTISRYGFQMNGPRDSGRVLDLWKIVTLEPTEAGLPWLVTALQCGVNQTLPALTKLGPKLKPALPELLKWTPAEYTDRPKYQAMLLAAGKEGVPALLEQFAQPDLIEQKYLLLPVLVKLSAESADARVAIEKWLLKNATDRRAAQLLITTDVATQSVFGPFWVAQLRGDEQQQLEAQQFFAKQGPDAAPLVPELVKLLAAVNDEKTPPRKTRVIVCEILGRVGPKAKEGVPELVRVFAVTDDPDARLAAILACSRIGKASVGPLVTALRHEKAPVRAGAAEALGKIGAAAKEDALPELLRLSENEQNGEVREQVQKALKRLEKDDR